MTALRAMMTDACKGLPRAGACATDLRRNRTDADLTDVKFLATDGLKPRGLSHLRQWMEAGLGQRPSMLGPALVRQFDPLGVGLVIGTWNYPLMLTLSPLIGAIAGGNAAVVKPSEVASGHRRRDRTMVPVPEYLDQGTFSVVLGETRDDRGFLEQQWDHIFFTERTAVAKVVMTAAARRTLTPVVLDK